MIFYGLGVLIVFLLLTTKYSSVVGGSMSFEFFGKAKQLELSEDSTRFLLALFWPKTLASFLFFMLTGVIKSITIAVLNKFKS